MAEKENITFYSIIPVFDFGILNKEFMHEGNYSGAKFSISFKTIQKGKEGFKELVKNADASIHRKLVSIHIPPSGIMGQPTDNFLFIEVTYPYDEEYKVTSDTKETGIIEDCILAALRLHSTKGLLYYTTYIFRNPPNPYKGASVGTRSPLMLQYFFGHLKGGVSTLPQSEYDNCKETFDILLKDYDGETSFDKIINLALRYHRITSNLERIEHSFLILMVVFESLFKKESELNAEKAADRISRLLSVEKSKQTSIKEEFFSEEPDSFCKIRNKIAHGDLSLNPEDVINKYPILYGYITKAITELISLSNLEIDKNDYYAELSRYVNTLNQA